MSITTTPELGLIKPDLTEPMPNWPSQHASNMDTLDQFYSTTLVSYTSVWSSSDNPQPSIGDGTIDARWMSLWDNLIYVNIRWLVGSTTTFGSSFWSFSLPFTAHALYSIYLGGPGALDTIGKAILRDNSPATARTGTVTVGEDLDNIMLSTSKGSGSGFVTPGSPWTWTSSDRIALYGIYVRA